MSEKCNGLRVGQLGHDCCMLESWLTQIQWSIGIHWLWPIGCTLLQRSWREAILLTSTLARLVLSFPAPMKQFANRWSKISKEPLASTGKIKHSHSTIISNQRYNTLLFIINHSHLKPEYSVPMLAHQFLADLLKATDPHSQRKTLMEQPSQPGGGNAKVQSFPVSNLQSFDF